MNTTTSKPIAAALAAIPGYTDALTTSRTLAAWPPPTIVEDDPAGAVWDAARRGEPTAPADLAERLARANLTLVGTNEAWSMIRAARGQAAAALDETVRANPDPALGYLADRLAEVLAAVREADVALPAGITAETAVRSGGKVLAAWQQLTAATDDYDEIRAVQWQVIGATARPAGVGDRREHRAWLLRSGSLADAIDHDPWWIDRRVTAARARLVTGSDGTQNWEGVDHREQVAVTDPDPTVADWLSQAAHPELHTLASRDAASDWRRLWLLACRPPAWPSPVAAGSWWPTDDRVNYLRWITTHAQPWVPTHAHLTAADTAALTATAPPPGGTRSGRRCRRRAGRRSGRSWARRVGDARRTT